MMETLRSLRDVVASPKKTFRQLRGNELYRNAIYLTLNSVVGSAIGFIFWAVVARIYPASAVGLASALLSSHALLNSISLLGLDISLIRFLPEDKNPQQLINSCFSVVSIFSALLAVIFLVGTPLWSPVLSYVNGNFVYFILFVAYAVISSLLLMQSQTFIALRSTGFVFAQQMIWHVLKIVLILVMVSFGSFGIFSAWNLAAVVALVVGSLFFLRKAQPGYKPVPSINKGSLTKMAQFSIENYVAGVIYSAPSFLIPLMVVNILGAESNAYFRIAFGVATILMAVPLSVTRSLFAEGSKDPQNLKKYIRNSATFIFIILVPASLVILGFGSSILLIFGKEYSQKALTLLWVLTLSSFPTAIIQLYSVIARIRLKVRPIIYAYSGVAIITLGGSYVLMKQFGLVGAAIGWISGLGLVSVVVGILTVKWLREDSSKGGP
jgi:O-antigen/teichoic acid export membrane protein